MKNGKEEVVDPATIKQAITYNSFNWLIETFNNVFNPQEFLSQTHNPNYNAVNPQIPRPPASLSALNPLFSMAKQLIDRSSKTSPHLKAAESNTLKELTVLAAMWMRPEYFQSLNESNINNDTSIEISMKFLEEFVNTRKIDLWVQYLKEEVKKNTNSDSSTEAINEIIDLFAYGIKEMAKADSPINTYLNKYIDPLDLKKAEVLIQWLEKSHGHKYYNDFQKQLQELEKKINASRNKAMLEGGEYIQSLVQLIAPEFNVKDIKAHFKEKAVKDKYLQFSSFMLKEVTPDIFEPNLLRNFWETIYRNQYNKVFYQVLCESLQDEFKDNLLHQNVHQIYTLSLLDTIHYQPLEARSRTPTHSLNGLPSKNFGYKMDTSLAYANWLKNNPLARIAGDIIVDAFEHVINIGKSLNINNFVNLLCEDIYCNDRYNTYQKISDFPFYDILYCFESFFFKKALQQSFKKNKRDIDTSVAQLLKEKIIERDFIEKAQHILEDFKNFCNNTSDLVLGVGFNGRLFNKDIDSNDNRKEAIWLAFSYKGRSKGGELLLELIKYFVSQSPNTSTDLIEQNGTIDKIKLEKYQPLIKWHIKQAIKYYSSGPKSLQLSDYALKKKALFKEFLSQLADNSSLYSNELIKWIKETSNWYKIPIAIKIAEELSVPELKLQEYTREVIFATLTIKYFFEKFPHLIDICFLNWKPQIISQLSNSDSRLTEEIKNKNFEQLSEPSKIIALQKMESIVKAVHSDIKSIWEPEIHELLQSYLRDKKIKLGEQGTSLQRKLKKELETLKKTEANYKSALDRLNNTLEKSDILEDKKHQETAPLAKKLKEIFEAQNATALSIQKDLQESKDNLDYLATVKDAHGLNEDHYLEFKKFFFQKRIASQCIEPLFAKTLGHDRFFSVFTTPNYEVKIPIPDPNDTEGKPLTLGNLNPLKVIPPCNNKCQFHALGHVYVGDLLINTSVDDLDEMRHIHGLGEVPDRMMTFPHYQNNQQPNDQHKVLYFPKDDAYEEMNLNGDPYCTEILGDNSGSNPR
jgi:hypothetical protein